jgi:hypothetical protein
VFEEEGRKIDLLRHQGGRSQRLTTCSRLAACADGSLSFFWRASPAALSFGLVCLQRVVYLGPRRSRSVCLPAARRFFLCSWRSLSIWLACGAAFCLWRVLGSFLLFLGSKNTS